MAKNISIGPSESDPPLLELKNCYSLRQSQKIHLTPASFDPKLIKGQVLWYFNTFCNLEISSIGRNTFKRTHFNLAGKALSGAANQPLCHQAQGNRCLDSHDTPRERTNPDWTCTTSGDLKVKIFWNWSRWHLIRQLSQDIQIRSVESLSAKSLMVARCFRWSPMSMILITWALDKKCLRVLPCYSYVTSLSFQSAHSCQHYTKESFFLALRDQKKTKNTKTDNSTLEPWCFQRKILIKWGRMQNKINL